MDRSLDSVYEAARSQLEPLLASAGFRLACETHIPEAFGSAEAEYKRRDLRIRLTWDGKDRWLWCKVASVSGDAHPPPGSWRDLEAAVNMLPSTAHLRSGPLTEKRIREIKDALCTYLARGE